jgi:hypothetical protein
VKKPAATSKKSLLCVLASGFWLLASGFWLLYSGSYWLLNMITLQAIITLAYYALTAGAAALLVYNFVKAKSWERELLYLIVLVPFVLRVFHLK